MIAVAMVIRMVCELLLSSVWLLFVVFWVETISVWLFLCLFYQDRAFYHWGDGVFADDPGQMLYMLSRQKLRQALGGQVVLPDDWETTAEVIRETGRKVLGVSSGRRKEDKETWWWNEEVQDSIQRKRLAKKKWDMDRTEENRQEYKELQCRVKREVSKAKQKAYEELYTRLDTREGQDLYRLARQRDRDGKDVQQVRVIKDRDGRVLTSEESVQRRWKEYFEELMNEENEREKRVEGVNSVEQEVDKIRKDEVRKALKRMKSGKAVGPDDIPVEVWKCLGEAAVEFLANLFNRVLESERMPEEWRRSVLVPIFKNKGDVQSCSNYRGIKLMSHTMKVWERVVEARLRKVVDICEQQYGFMPRKSTTDAIFALRILMEKYRDGQKELHCVFVDLEKAYDRVPREELWYCMRKSGVAEKYVRVVQDMYERSRTVVRCAVGQTEEFNVEVGLHQGSALSPFLFAIVMDQLSEEVRQESPWTMMFADDIVICSESREQVEENLERWRFALERRGMKVSRSKTEYMCVNEREGSGTVRLQGEEVKKVQEFKYLGSTVQSNGECGKEVKKRVQAGWNGWRKVSGVLCDQKISARIKGKVYRTVVRPAMLYGLETVSLRKRQESELEVAELKMLRSSSHRTVPERSGVVCRVKYCNSLPDIPFDPKFITYPFDQHRFVQYKATSLEKQHKHELLTEPDLGVTIDLINPDTYRIDPNILLDPADEKLLEEEIQAPTSSKRSQQHAKVVPWMRKTEYISTEFNRYGVSNDKVEVKIGVSVKQQFTEEEIYKDRDSQISAIEKTFEDAQKNILQHYSKPRVTPVEVLPVFPDFKMWINPCAQVIFDSDPAPKDVSSSAAVDMMSQAMIRGMMDEEGNQFVAYFLPNEDTLRKRKRDVEEEVDYMPEDLYDYKIAREYNWNVKNKASKGYEENYFFIFRDGDGVYYNELETRVRLSKRRAKAGAQSTTNAVLVCKHRDMNEKELEAQEARRAQLENHEPEDEEEDMDKDNQDSGDEKEKDSESENSDSGSDRDEEDDLRGDNEEEEEEEEEEGRKASGSESGEDRHARDEEEIFGSDDDSEEEDEGGARRRRSSGSEDEDAEDEGGRASGSASPAHSSSGQSEGGGGQSGSDRGSDSSDGSDSE
ncbi:hypothetical protein QTP86_030648 [Hemibagrus guttatus]|nr:hypothetical protein QTP86_030648 [Hemibagrus guttatus]